MKRLLSTALVLLLLAVAHPASAVAPAWAPGFPVRAGAVVILLWNPVPNATDYKVTRKTDDGTSKIVFEGPGTSFNDAEAPPDRTFIYQIVATVDGKPSDPSPVSILKGKAAMAAPTFTGTLVTDAIISIKWSNPSGAVFFNIYRSESQEGPFSLLTSVQQDSYTDTTLVKNRSYWYRITAIDTSGQESPQSKPIQASLQEQAARKDGESESGPKWKPLVSRGSFQGETGYLLNQPGEAGFTSNGEMFVLERRGIQFFDNAGTYKNRLPFPAEWKLASGATLDRDDSFLLPFYGEEVVRKIDSNGKVLLDIRYPRAKVKVRRIVADNVVVADAAKGTTAPVANTTVETEFTEIELLNNPNSVAVDDNGFYWIADGIRSQLIKTDGSGKELAVIGRIYGTYDIKDTLPTDLPSLKKVVFNKTNGMLYALLGASCEIKVIDPKNPGTVKTYGGFGMTTGRFQAVGGYTFLSNGNILVLDAIATVVKEFTSDFAYVATWADIQEKKKFRLSTALPNAITTDPNGKRIYIVSSLGNRVTFYDLKASDGLDSK